MGGSCGTNRCCTDLRKDDEEPNESMPGVVVSHGANTLDAQAANKKVTVTGDTRPAAAPPALSSPDVAAMKKQQQQQADVRVKIQRPTPQATLGVDVAFDEDETSFFIERLYAGLVKEWNATNPELQVDVGDHVVEVNGISGNALEMAEACKKAESLEMVIRRT